MTRRLSTVSQDDVRRAVKAAQACGLEVSGVEIEGTRIRILVGKEKLDLDETLPENVHSLDEYKAWRDRSRARGD
jgi:hypothetical protein